MNLIFCRMRCLFLVLWGGVYSIAHAQVNILTVKESAPQIYTVVKGDTLWSIAQFYLDSPWLWPELWRLNPAVDNPHRIYPGDTLLLQWVDGQPTLIIKPTKKLTPKMRLQNKEALSSVRGSAIQSYWSSNRLLDNKRLLQVAKILGNRHGHQYSTRQNTLYISGQHTQIKWGVYRPVAVYGRDKTKEKVTALRLIAKAELIESGHEFSGLMLTSQRQEVTLDDVALPLVEPELTPSMFTFPFSPAPKGLSAQVLGNMTGTALSAADSIVVLNKGTLDELHQGNVLELREAAIRGFSLGTSFDKPLAQLTKKVVLPPISVGELVVIRSYRHFSLAIIVRSIKPITAGVFVVSPLNKRLSLHES
ncbi:LysM peptidoglycan-binding domain-containing protein [Vibrio sagamiensis]|uniref:Peptidoglycan-binding protein n=1 Tax=Vibrio sagamiensis NBRC 104589 TaxID=1219064 RepID=A0A511QG27_9VIBR|nr:LysM domain-containing protein [Vibrio sagamiensis]PNQ71166.1 LysM domain-containing protein [Vibrio agarivorans]GEM76260.1 peptidoglycan-binding protein [Vibrio sagamiensis NBRC 104589]